MLFPNLTSRAMAILFYIHILAVSYAKGAIKLGGAFLSLDCL
jgi:hypothetical protein